jgi:acetyltransferase-like isoleucine patch superfamily enzyme
VAPSGGGFLPPIEFTGCKFDSQVDVSGAHIQSLDLVDCRLPGLRAQAARFAGSVRLHRCGPLDPGAGVDFGASDFIGWPDGQEVRFTRVPSALGGEAAELHGYDGVTRDEAVCEVFLRGATIGAGLDIDRCSLCAQRIKPEIESRSMRDISALELSHAHVRDRVELTRSTFVGGARFVGACVGDDVWILGGKFLGYAERHALDFQSARIGGQLSVKSDNGTGDERLKWKDAFNPVLVIGQFSAIGLSAGEVWITGGFFHGHDPDHRGAAPTLNFSKSDIRRTFKLGFYHPHYFETPARTGDRVYVHGELCLIAANIGKNLEVHGAKPRDAYDSLDLGKAYEPFFGGRHSRDRLFKLSGHTLKVDRRVSISQSHFSAGQDGDESQDVQAANKDASTPTAAAIDLFKATIGTGLKIFETVNCDGAVRLNNSVIGREVNIGCRIIEAPAAHKNEPILPWLLDLRESTVNGFLKIGRRTHDGTAVTIAGGITLENARVQRSATLRRLKLDLSEFPAGAPDQPLRQRTALNLRDFVCGSEFEVHCLRWKLPPLTSAEEFLLDRGRRARLWNFPPTAAKRQLFNIERAAYAIIDMRGFRCTLLSDDAGEGWGLIYRLRLRLASFHVEEVEPGSQLAQARLRWLSFQNRTQRVSREIETPPHPASPSGRPCRTPLRLWDRYLSSRDDDFVRHAYDVFAAANDRAGEDAVAEEIVVERKNVQATLRFTRSWHRAKRRRWLPVVALLIPLVVQFARNAGLLPMETAALVTIWALACIVALWPLVLAALQLIARWPFRYGFSVEGALSVLAACIFVGAGTVHVARYGGVDIVKDWNTKMDEHGHLDASIVLVLDTPYLPEPPSTAQAGPEAAHGTEPPVRHAEMASHGGTRMETRLTYGEPSPCNLDVNSILYAADVFIRVLDLDQESRCSIRHADIRTESHYTGWRFAKALYELLGWIVTSLVILILTGVLRRDLERRANSEPSESPGGER